MNALKLCVVKSSWPAERPSSARPRRPGSGLRGELLQELLEGVYLTAGQWGAVGEVDRVEVLGNAGQAVGPQVGINGECRGADCTSGSGVWPVGT
ncbi:hypothetical protein ACFWVU_31070 [Streptomyces sp. NPDC058686]|uniref:hypothetical protein n=1 Tax=Streptomyces sp. NPDC058686 TaxID=3346599 RepID=UPI0036497F8A